LPVPLPLPFADGDPVPGGVALAVGALADVASACFVLPGGVAGFEDVVGVGCCAVVGVACVTVVVAFFFAAGFELVCAVVAFARLAVLDC
jgi:hypothetical protein